MSQIVRARVRRWSAGASFLASFSYCLNSPSTSRWSSVSRSTASASRIVFGAVFSAVFSALGGFGVARVVVRDFFAAGAALVRFIAGDADLAREVDEPRDDEVLGDDVLRAREPAAGLAREAPLRVVAFFAEVLADFFAVFDAAFLARFALAYATSYGSLLFRRLLSGEPRFVLSSAITAPRLAGASPSMRRCISTVGDHRTRRRRGKAPAAGNACGRATQARDGQDLRLRYGRTELDGSAGCMSDWAGPP